MPEPVRALRYAARFQCIADRCEDTCCAGLRVPIEASAFDRLRGLLGKNAEDRTAFEGGVERELGGAEGFARFRMREDGSCPFLDGRKLCGLHQRFGEAALPDVCALFPRVLTPAPDQVELTASLACPEAARLALLAGDAMEWTEAPAPARLALHQGRGERSHLEHAAAKVLALREVPLRTRLIHFAQLAMRPDTAELETLATVEVARNVHDTFRTMVFPWGRAAQLFVKALHQRLGFAAQPRFVAFAEDLLGRIELAGSGEDDAVAAYQAGRDALDATFGARVDQYFRNYAAYQLARHPIADAPSPIAYVCRLAVRIALLRFGLSLRGAGAGSREELDTIAVETFQLTAKHLEQHPTFRELVDGLLACEDEARFAKTLLFATFA